ncbi:DUF2189 domain-containing protein [Zeimonas arvi]|uniref:DUF2189 domain-containing protein n=1 Tax=Zeimonas arvi TaxID=2498847 RepID=A0A5C8P5E1_9BURK|nr:DUF2189 domain-containing protein [Zeimonas arvi]TXL68629.1 DUF2189 domain-containing protein [Zeimonas arvi]
MSASPGASRPGSAPPLPALREITPAHVAGWLAAGWRDFARAPLASALHGLLFLAGALAIVAVGWRDSGLLAGAFTGFVIVAPVLVTGFHELSRRLEAGERLPPLGLLALLAVWKRRGAQLAALGGLLAVAGTLWVGFSSMLVRLAGGSGAGSAASGYAGGVAGFVHQFLAAGDAWLLVWFLAGGLGAAIVFAVTAVSVPLLVDRPVPLATAIRTSVAAVGLNPVSLGVWAAAIMALTLLGFVTVIGLAVVLPVLGHATWHAYRDLVEPMGGQANPARAPRAGR